MPMQEFSLHEKIRIMMSRFKCVKDLWTYLTTRQGILLPPLKRTSKTFLSQIMYQKKKYLFQKDVPAKRIPKWPELDVIKCYHMIAEQCPEVLDYLPDPCGSKQQILPEREFFWRVLYALMPQKTDEFIMQVAEQRKQKPNLQDEKFKVGISEEFVDKLLEYDFQSTKKGRAHSSLFYKVKPRGQKKTNRGEEQILSGAGQILKAPNGGDIGIWYKKLTPAQQAAYKRGLYGQSASGLKSEGDFMNRQQTNVNGFDSALGEDEAGINEGDEFHELNESQHK